ncbi:SEC-C metal-binding domain-containing protein [Bacillus sp. AK128]
MSDKVNRAIEKQMIHALQGLQEYSRKQKEKQYKRNWGQINVPFTLNEGLRTYTKTELDGIRKRLNIPNASHLKKEELISLLEERIPRNLEFVCQYWDIERFKMLLDLAGNGGHMMAPDLEASQITYLRECGFFYTGTLNGKKILAVPVELIEPITALKDNLQVRAKVNRNTEWIKLTAGLLYYYGTLELQQLEEMIEKYTKENLHLREYLDVIHELKSYRKVISISKDGYSNSRVFDPVKVKNEHKMRKDVSFYPFTKQQLLTAGEPGFVERNQSYLQLVSFLTKNFEVSKAEADDIVEECVYANRVGESPNHIMQFLANKFEFDHIEAVRALMDHVVYLMNNTREWFLKGHSSMELRKMEKSELPLKQTTSKIEVKISRNALCPCGSGKKFKKCCGK